MCPAAPRALITRRTLTIGALLPDLHGEFFSELMRGIDRAARERGLHMPLSTSHVDRSRGRRTSVFHARLTVSYVSKRYRLRKRSYSCGRRKRVRRVRIEAPAACP